MSEQLAETSQPPRSRSLGLVILFVVCGAIFLEGIDVAMFNVALPSIRDDLQLAPTDIHWVISAYVLGYGGFVLLGGQVADRLGRRRVFLAALAVFLLFTAIGGASTTGWVLIVARGVTGVAAAFMAPAGLSILTTSFAAGPARERAVLIYSGVAAGGFTLGLVFGGLLTMLGWRWVFIAPFVFGLVVCVLALRVLPRSEDARMPGARVYLVRSLTLTAALVTLVLAIQNAPEVPVIATVATALVSVALIAMLVALKRRSGVPMLPPGILRIPGFLRANIAIGLLSAGFLGFQFLLVLYLQDQLGWTVLQTSLAMLVMGIDLVLAPLLAPRLVARFGAIRVAAVGLGFAVASYALMLPVSSDWTYAAMLPSFLALGIAFALAYGPLTIAVTDRVGEEAQGAAGGLLYTFFQLGGAVGLSIAAAVFAHVGTLGLPGLEIFRMALLAPLGLAVLAVVVIVLRRTNTATTDPPRSPHSIGHGDAHCRDA